METLIKQDNKSQSPVLFQSKHFDPNLMTIDWYIGKRCNFSCSYCSFALHDSWSPTNSLTELKTIFHNIIQISEDKNIYLNMAGGEPTLNPNLLELLKYIRDYEKNISPRRIKISIVTNLSRPTKDFIGYLEYVDSLIASLHFEWIHNRLDHFVDKITKISLFCDKKNKQQKNSRMFTVRFMLIPNIRHAVDELESKLQGLNFIWDYRIARLPNPHTLNKYKKKDEKDGLRWLWRNKKEWGDRSLFKLKSHNKNRLKTSWIKRLILPKKYAWIPSSKKIDSTHKEMDQYIDRLDNGSTNEKRFKMEFDDGQNRDLSHAEVLLEKHNRFKGWKCWIGCNYLKVDHRGEVYTGNCHQEGPVTNFKHSKQNFKLRKEPLICEQWRCVDYLDLCQPKEQR